MSLQQVELSETFRTHWAFVNKIEELMVGHEWEQLTLDF